MRSSFTLSAIFLAAAIFAAGCADKNAITPKYLETVDITSISDPARLTAIGNGFIETGAYLKAIESLRRAVKIAPDDPAANNYLGLAYVMTGDTEKAKMYLRIAISLKPDYDDAFYNLGDAFYREGNLDEAMKNYKTAISINSGYSAKKRSFTGAPFIPIE